MADSWQTPAAIGVVVVTMIVFVVRFFVGRAGKKAGGTTCDGGCDCGETVAEKLRSGGDGGKAGGASELTKDVQKA